jgi:ArsR family transcriptional regulator, arsenate/arsenite/antimonite-responsive transcriptional repressor
MIRQDSNDLAEVFKAMGDPTRLSIFKMLSANPKAELCVCAIAARLQITQSAVSQHLKVLKNAGLVTPNRDGFRVHYSVNTGKLKSVWASLESMMNAPAGGDR